MIPLQCDWLNFWADLNESAKVALGQSESSLVSLSSHRNEVRSKVKKCISPIVIKDRANLENFHQVSLVNLAQLAKVAKFH